MTEEYGHISDAFDNLPEEELLMTEARQHWCSLNNLPEQELFMTEEQIKKMANQNFSMFFLK